MIPARIEGATRYLGAPVGWTPEEHVPCSHLAILDIADERGHPVMMSAWEPSPADLAVLNAGGKVYLQIWGQGHPPVMLVVA